MKNEVSQEQMQKQNKAYLHLMHEILRLSQDGHQDIKPK